MKIIIQRVEKAAVYVDNQCVSQIAKGLLLFLGVGEGDTQQKAEKFLEKIVKLRIFCDDNGKTNLSLMDIGGEILVVSQFTLYADCRKGNRPSFTNVAPPKEAEDLYEYFLESARKKIEKVEAGSFGADMKVELVNDGPFTITLDDTVIKA